ncbi:hypothetical protein H2248_009184 [Termitomyces sp. 'cryptogamus']|nr:hypothetical protein H2248_009184 [Termitomyces sp. 'cryptogamus']
MTTVSQKTPAKRRNLPQARLALSSLIFVELSPDLIRTRDPAVLATCNIVVDVGVVYDESKQRFDHHQRGFTEVFGHGSTTKLSSAGLVYKHFGKEFIANATQPPVDDGKLEKLWLKLYKEFIEAIDAIDNVISQYLSDIKASRVGHLNPAWNQLQTVDVRYHVPLNKFPLNHHLLRPSLAKHPGSQAKNSWDVWITMLTLGCLQRDLLLSSIAKSKETIDSTNKIILLEQSLNSEGINYVMSYKVGGTIIT